MKRETVARKKLIYSSMRNMRGRNEYDRTYDGPGVFLTQRLKNLREGVFGKFHSLPRCVFRKKKNLRINRVSPRSATSNGNGK